MKAEDTVRLEPENTPMGRFQKERTDAISEMFDNEDEYGIYPTGKFFARLDNCVRELLGACKGERAGHCSQHNHFVDECMNCHNTVNEGIDWQAQLNGNS